MDGPEVQTAFKRHDVVALNCLLSALCRYNQVKTALELFDRMKDRITQMPTRMRCFWKTILPQNPQQNNNLKSCQQTTWFFRSRANAAGLQRWKWITWNATRCSVDVGSSIIQFQRTCYQPTITKLKATSTPWLIISYLGWVCKCLVLVWPSEWKDESRWWRDLFSLSIWSIGL